MELLNTCSSIGGGFTKCMQQYRGGATKCMQQYRGGATKCMQQYRGWSYLYLQCTLYVVYAVVKFSGRSLQQ